LPRPSSAGYGRRMSTILAPSRQYEPDQRVVLHGVTWDGLENILAARGDKGAVRITYLEGKLELMSPSRSHEFVKTLLGRLLEVYAEEVGIELEGYGSWTIKKRTAESAAEPDECYVVGSRDADVPDIAVEVVWTGGGIGKLDVYRQLGVREILYWHNHHLRLFSLGKDGRYRPAKRSRFLPGLDLHLIEGCLAESSQTRAVRRLRVALRRERRH
jgi:Uma2 family endonuclease